MNKNKNVKTMSTEEFAAYVINKSPENKWDAVDIKFYGSYNCATEKYEQAYKLKITGFADSDVVLCNYCGGGRFFAHELNYGKRNWAAKFINRFSAYLINNGCEEVYIELVDESNLNGSKSARLFTATVEIERALFDRVNSLLEIEDLNILNFCLDDFTDANGEHSFTEEELAEIEEEKRMAEFLDAKRDDCIPLFDIKFDNGHSITIDVCSGNENYYDNNVLYGENGFVLATFDCMYSIDKRMEFNFNDVTYIVELNIAETAV